MAEDKITVLTGSKVARGGGATYNMVVTNDALKAVIDVVFQTLLRKIVFVALGGVFALSLMNAVLGEAFVPYDSTDGKDRSGMGLHTDCETGLQYLSTPSGGITPRLDEEGAQIQNFSGC